MFDLIVRNASLPDGRTGMDIAVKDGTIEALDRAMDAEAARRSMPAGTWSPRPSWTAIFTWTPP